MPIIALEEQAVWSGISTGLASPPFTSAVAQLTQTTCSGAMKLLSLVSALSLICFATADSNVVDLGYAKYRGNQSFPNTVAYLGLPYAEPPVGDLRWRSTLPLNTSRVSQQAHGAVVDATKDPEFCIQGTTGGKPVHLLITRPFLILYWVSRR